jgi:acetyl-CoA carboxylase carboxyl transferase subunit alpha
MESQPLDFEKPILELQRRLQELKSHSDKHDIDFDSEVESMELKIRETRREIYENLTAWQRVPDRASCAAPLCPRLHRALLYRMD